MILQLGYKVLPETGRASATDTHLDYVHSINLEEATTRPFPYSQGMADLVERRH